MTKDIVEEQIKRMKRRFFIWNCIQGVFVALFLISAVTVFHYFFL